MTSIRFPSKRKSARPAKSEINVSLPHVLVKSSLDEDTARGYSTEKKTVHPEFMVHSSPSIEDSIVTLLLIAEPSPITESLTTEPAPIVTLSPIVLPSIYAVG
jgi:hypothetical protein